MAAFSLKITALALAMWSPALFASADAAQRGDGRSDPGESIEIPGLPSIQLPPGMHVYGRGLGQSAPSQTGQGRSRSDRTPPSDPEQNAGPDPRDLPRPNADIYHEYGTVMPGGGRRQRLPQDYGGTVIGPGGVIPPQIRQPDPRHAQSPPPKKKAPTAEEKQAQIRKALMPKPPLAVARRKTLDDLYTKLAASRDEDEAKGLASLISAIWMRSGSDTAALLMQRAETAVTKKDYPLALSVLDRVVDLQPNWAEAWNRRASVRYLSGDLDGAMADVDHVLKLEPKHFAALGGMAAILQRTGFDKRALQIYRRDLAIYPLQPEIQKIVDKLTLEVEGQGI